MEEAIDDWLSRQIQWLRRKEVLYPDGTFFLRLRIQGLLNDSQTNQGPWQNTTKQSGRRVAQPGSFEQQLEATRRASDLKKMIFDGAPATLVSLIGHKQYRRCARDVYYFLQLRDIVTDTHEKMRVRPE